MTERPAGASETSVEGRRGFVFKASTAAMGAGLAASYGTLAAMMGRFVYPATGEARGWLFVSTIVDFPAGGALDFETPSGAKIVVARHGDGETEDDFLALSSVCPHLGCSVHWEQPRDRFFCPCHNGAFDRTGKATEGPPLAANQSLTRYPLKVEDGLLYIEAPLTSLVQASRGRADTDQGVA